MALPTGTKLGPYEIQSPLGVGGMGEVYRARDPRLERTVAIKVLPTNLSSDPNLRQRLEREAKAVSKLSHPHICTLCDIGHQDGIDFLIMELVEGETLEQRLTKGPLPPDQTIRCGAQIADALAKAHKLGITHRDLKPSNVMLTKLGAKLMDFGLAKESSVAPLSAALTEMTSERSKLTGEGMLVGTFQYMAPEQLEGKEADARTDIFALGEVLYEMATGKPAFGGKSPASLIAAILTTDPPPITQFQPMTPPSLERIVKKCLAKDPEDRRQSASDLAAELYWISESSQAGAPALAPARREGRDRVGWLLAGLLLLLLIGAGAAWWIGSHRSQPAMYFTSPFPLAANDVALSPDGRVLAIVAYSDQAHTYVIWTHVVGSPGATTVPGTEEASHPFWSPDGRSIGFFAAGKLKKVMVSPGGPAQIICDAPSGRGGTWNQNGVILFTPEAFGGLYRVSSGGGIPVAITTLDSKQFEQSHRWPVFLPDGRHFLYLAANFAGHFEKNTILLGSLDSDERRALVSASSNAAFADPGYLLYLRDNVLVAQPFDTRRYKLSGEPHIVSSEVQYLPRIDLALFGVRGKDILVLQTGKGASKSQITWFDRTGRQIGTVGPAGSITNPRLSPNGQRVAADRTDSDGRRVNIWIHDLSTDAMTRFTFGASLDEAPIWSNDGKRIVFTSNRKRGFDLYQKNTDGTGAEQEIASGVGNIDLPAAQQMCWDWSRDGKYLLKEKKTELWYVSLPDGQAKPLLQGDAVVRNAQFSPDAKWIAYSSNETGHWEIYVSPFPKANSKWQVSKAGGKEPRWRRDGKELFYLSAEGKLMAVPVKTAGSFEAGPPVPLFQTEVQQSISTVDVFSYDVTADGKKFLVNKKLDEPNTAPLSIILNWASEMGN